jgi:hypothetical protein
MKMMNKKNKIIKANQQMKEEKEPMKMQHKLENKF